MSRLFPERVFISLAPGALGYARLAGGVRPNLADKRLVALPAAAMPAAPAGGAAAPQPWHDALAALAELQQSLDEPRLPVTVVLSNHFVRYVLVPQSDELKGGADELAFARYCFGKVHGERSKGWDIRLAGAEGGAMRVASAIDTALLEQLRAAFPEKGRLRSVQPYLMSAFNGLRRALARAGDRPAWLLLAEPGRACLAHIENGRWDMLQNNRGIFETPQQWAELLDRERHLVASAVGTEVLVHAPHLAPAEHTQAGGWHFTHLALQGPPGYVPYEDAPLGMALIADSALQVVQ